MQHGQTYLRTGSWYVHRVVDPQRITIFVIKQEEPYEGRLSVPVPTFFGIRFCENLGVKLPGVTRLAAMQQTFSL